MLNPGDLVAVRGWDDSEAEELIKRLFWSNRLKKMLPGGLRWCIRYDDFKRALRVEWRLVNSNYTQGHIWTVKETNPATEHTILLHPSNKINEYIYPTACIDPIFQL